MQRQLIKNKDNASGKRFGLLGKIALLMLAGQSVYTTTHASDVIPYTRKNGVGVEKTAVITQQSNSKNELTVKGCVTSPEGERLIGVSVLIKGTAKGVATDIDGNYTINVPIGAQLVFSYMGYISQEKASQANLNVTLQEDKKQLEEVMVVAYGTAKKSSFTGSAAIVKKDVLEKTQVSNLTKALQGITAGVEANSSSGQPGTAATIRIRGIGSINASSDPLYVVDGVPFEGDLNAISPNDIESMTILKDAASSALYGSRGANGVIVITTKQGHKEAKPAIDLRVSYGISDRAVGDYKQLSTNEYFELYWEALRNYRLTEGDSEAKAAAYASANVVPKLGYNPYGSMYSTPVGEDGKVVAGAYSLVNDDWVDALSQKARRTEVQLSVSGGSKNTKYFVSGAYLDDQGVALASGFKRYTGRVNLSSDIKKWITIGTNVGFTHSVQDYPTSEDTKVSNVINFGRSIPSFYPIYERNDDGSYKLANGEKVIDYGTYRPSGAMQNYNLLGSLPYDKNEIKKDAASIRGFADVNLGYGFTYKTSINIDYNNTNTHDYVNPTYGASTTNGSVSRYTTRSTGMTYNNLLNNNKEINSIHNIKFLLGQEYYQYNRNNFGGSRQNFPLLGYEEPNAASVLVDFEGYADEYKLLSYFGNAEYAYNNRYFLSGSVRVDGSSRFHPDSRWGTFWSVGASWKLSEEEFIKQHDWISNMTLRASYGAQGNDNLSTYYAYKAAYGISNNLGESGVIAQRLPTPDLKWESNMNLNIGLEAAFLNHRISATVEYFNRASKDLLFAMPMSPSTGFTSIDRNIGALTNNGWEAVLNVTPILTDNWQWDVSVNATSYKNKITKLPQESIISGTKRLIKGGSVYDFFIAEWAGVNPENGNPQWYATSNTGERVVTENYDAANSTDSKINAGSALADVTGGFSTKLKYRNIECSAVFAGQIGGKIYNQDKLGMLHTGTNAGRSWSKEMLNRWTPENTDTDVPILTTSSKYSWTSQSTRFLYDASYLRLKNLSISYSLPRHWMQRLDISHCRLFFTADNIWTLFKEQGLDPEQAIGGVTYFRYPTMKTFSFGLNIKL